MLSKGLSTEFNQSRVNAQNLVLNDFKEVNEHKARVYQAADFQEL